MLNDIVFLEPVFKDMIWGGTRLNKLFDYQLPTKTTGECWGIAAHENGDCVIKNTKYQGKTLSLLWKEHRELFGNFKGDIFPLLIKIIDANNDLSIQVHPNDEYAANYHLGALGKTECWLVLDCDEDSEIVIGHNAKDKEELEYMINNKLWDKFIRSVPIKKGDFFQIEPGCLHAIKKGTLILETQQNSDITFRVYDYDRLQSGKPRKLHLKESLECIKVPFSGEKVSIEKEKTSYGEHIHYIDCKYYSVDRYKINSSMILKRETPFVCVSIIEGSGKVNNYDIKKGDHFIITSECDDAKFEGNLDIVCSVAK